MHRLTERRRNHLPVGEVVAQVNRLLVGWGNYFGLGYPSRAFGRVNWYVSERLGAHLKRRSQRGWRPRAGESLHAALTRLGLYRLKWRRPVN